MDKVNIPYWPQGHWVKVKVIKVLSVFDDSCSEPIPKSPSKNSKTGVEKEEIPDIISLESQPENERIYDLYWSNGTDKFCILKGDDAEFQRAVKVGVCVSLVS